MKYNMEDQQIPQLTEIEEFRKLVNDLVVALAGKFD